jgi:hypothetical protein
MRDPQIICPQCSTPIKLTESLAAPLIAQTRKQFEAQLASKEADFARRETVLRQTTGISPKHARLSTKRSPTS